MLFFSFLADLDAQRLDHRQGELIVDLKDGTDFAAAVESVPLDSKWEILSRPLNIWLLQYDHNRAASSQITRALLKLPEVDHCQSNKLTDLRQSPNDPLYNQQWQHLNTGQSGGVVGADHKSEAAWDITTGGLTPNGDTIVVCVIDNGIDLSHPDLQPNIWLNHDEIPNNGIDDDNNGYIDDYQGWNTRNDNGTITAGSHGSSVGGIVGARGDNGLGVTGINWRVKLMVVQNDFIAAESEVIQAYSYALEQRMAYDQSHGQAGAYVVATNASWGISGGQADDSPIWCALYDSLGQHGILNAAATANDNVNVDQVGDLPTTCPSDFLLSVTNVDHNNQRVTGAGFGATHIDLGAHGEQVFTTRSNGSYGNFNGTSAASPAVAGAIGLLYSAPCPSFGALLSVDPAAAALAVREAILSGTEPNSSLEGLSVSGGVLDLEQAMQTLMSSCDQCLSPTSIAVTTDGTDGLLFSWNSIAAVEQVDLAYRVSGSQGSLVIVENVQSPFLLDGLESCTAYEYELRYHCGGQTQTTAPAQIVSDGCCRNPEALELSLLWSTLATLVWEDQPAISTYMLRHREVGSSDWIVSQTSQNTFTLTGLTACTDYEVQIAGNCDTAQTQFGVDLLFRTPGCGSCLDAEYCLPPSWNNASEWIQSVNVGNRLVNESGRDPSGYGNFTGVGESPQFALEGSYGFEGVPAFDGVAFNEEFKVWIDFDQNGFFTSSEVVVETSSLGGETAMGQIVIPENAIPGLTRMRVAMQFNSVSSACPVTTRTGEIEDYCLHIIESPGCVPPESIRIGLTDELVSTISWTASLAAGNEYLLRYRPLGSLDPWEEVNVSGHYYELDLSDSCQVYEIQIASLCGGETGPFLITSFNSCTSVSNVAAEALFELFPNPADRWVELRATQPHRLRRLEVYQAQGASCMISENLQGSASIRVDLSQWASGVYLLRVVDERNRSWVERLIVR